MRNPPPTATPAPFSTIRDSANRFGDSKAEFFFVKKVDGNKIKSSLSATIQENQGRGNHMKPVVLERQVPSRQAVFTSTGRTHHAMPIASLVATEYEAQGDVTVSPEQGRTYVVKGKLGEQYSAVSMEGADSGTPLGPRIEIKGSAALGFFEK